MNTWTCTRQGELYHHGIKGQKWGVRRFQNKDGSLTPAGRKRYDDSVTEKQKSEISDEERKRRIKRNIIIGASAAAAGLAVIGTMYYANKYNVNLKKLKSAKSGAQEISTRVMKLNELSGEDKIIKKGTKFQRISSMKFEDYADKGRIIYTSHIKSDNAIYMRDMPKNISSWRRQNVIKDGGKDVYKHVMSMNKDIKVASPRKVLEAFEEATGIKNPKQYEYMNFMTELVDRDNEQNKKFFSILKEAGYNAIVDENDAKCYTKEPIILLDAAKDIANIKTSKVNKINSIISVLMYDERG